MTMVYASKQRNYLLYKKVNYRLYLDLTSFSIHSLFCSRSHPRSHIPLNSKTFKIFLPLLLSTSFITRCHSPAKVPHHQHHQLTQKVNTGFQNRMEVTKTDDLELEELLEIQGYLTKKLNQ